MQKSIITFLLVLLVALSATAAYGAAVDQVINGLGDTGTAAGFRNDPDGTPAQEFARAFSTYATGLAGILSALFVVIMIRGGYLWMTANGNDESINRSKKMILGAVIGITLIIAARIIAELVIFQLNQIVIPT